MTDQVDWITNKSESIGLKKFFSVTSITTTQGKTTEKSGYYMASQEATAEELLYMSRSDWKIERCTGL